MISVYLNNGKLFGKSNYGFYAISSLPIIDEKLVLDGSTNDLSNMIICLNAQTMYDGIHASNLSNLQLPNLHTVYGEIYLRNITKYNLNNLKIVNGDIIFKEIDNLYLPNLQKVDSILIEDIDEVSLTNLETCNIIYVENCKKLNTPVKCIVICDENTECDCPNATIYAGSKYRLIDGEIFVTKSQDQEDNYIITLLECVNDNNKVIYCLEDISYTRVYANSKEEAINKYRKEKGEIDANVGSEE